MKQQNLFEHAGGKALKKRYNRVVHGGRDTKGHRKLERPLSTKRPVHIVLKSKRAIGKWSFLGFKNKVWIESLIRKKARKFGVTIHDFANVGNHLHIKARFQTRTGFQNFLRSVTSLVARRVTGAARGRKVGKFWEGLAFTRVLKSYLEEVNLAGYLIANRREAIRGPEAREKFLREFRAWVNEQYRTSSA